MPSTLYSNLGDLRHSYNLGIPSAVAYMQGLQEYTEECLHEQEKWSMDHQAEIRQNHSANYPKRDYSSTLQPWYTINRPEDSLPRAIESSRPLGQASKQRCYWNSHTP